MNSEKKRQNKAVAKKAPKRSAASKKKGKKSQGKVAGWITFLKEVQTELRKVTWPPRREIVNSTVALIVATLLIGAFLGTVDLVLANGIQPALTGNAGVMSIVTMVMFVGLLLWVYKSN